MEIPTSTAHPFLPAAVDSNEARLVVGSGDVLLGEVTRLIDDADSRVWIDIFRTSHEPTMEALAGAAERGVAVHVMGDARELEHRPPALPEDGISIQAWHDKPGKQHAKVVAIDDRSAIVGTDVAASASLQRIEAGVQVFGPAADAVRNLQRAARSGNPTWLREAAAESRPHGIYVNEPYVGVLDASAAIDHLLGSAEEQLTVVSRHVRDETARGALMDAATRGVDVRLVTVDEYDGDELEELRAAGVTVTALDKGEARREGRMLHGLLAVADGAGLVSTAYLDPRLLRGSAGRQSREATVLLDGPLAQELHAAIDSTWEP